MASCNEIATAVVVDRVAPRAATACAAFGPRGWRAELGGDTEALFDLASVTKPMTALAAVLSGQPRDLRLGDALPELAATRSGDVPLEFLLAHRAGLAPHLPLWELLSGGASLREVYVVAANAREQGPVPTEGLPPLYSDTGYILAGLMLGRRTGLVDAGAAIDEWVVGPLGLRGGLGTARDLCAFGLDVPTLSAPTEDSPARGGVVRGFVHDENAWALTGEGGSGHAGMFGTVGAVLTFGCAVLDALVGRSGRWASAAAPDLGWLVSERRGGTLRAGFDGKSAVGSSAGSRFGPRSIGHLGFTGTSLWLDPDAQVVAVLLTNRVHPTRQNLAIREARPRAHDALFDRAVELRHRDG